jgi:D-alanyl-D-alanine dipeptidase
MKKAWMRGCHFLFLLFFIITVPGRLRAEEVRAPAAELRRVDEAVPGILVDLRYATPDNFTGKVIYSDGTAWLRPETLARLRDVQKTLKRQGFQLVILDAYRPAWAQQKLWEAFPNANFVAPPKQGSRHTRGTTVDVTLATLEGQRVEMPSGYDEFSRRADHDFSDLPEKPRKHGNILRKAMFDNGFSGVPAEWWHYDLKNWNRYSLIVEKK